MGGLLLSKITNFILFEAVCTAANFPKASVRGEDLIEVNPQQNTFPYCTAAVEPAERVLRLKELVIGTHTYAISVYGAPDESQGRGVIRGVDLRLDHQSIQEELQDPRNPPIVDFRRLGEHDRRAVDLQGTSCSHVDLPLQCPSPLQPVQEEVRSVLPVQLTWPQS
ncbi:hypothetical protein MTO96_052356 [Rhipicephalus appendiculatus]